VSTMQVYVLKVGSGRMGPVHGRAD